MDDIKINELILKWETNKNPEFLAKKILKRYNKFSGDIKNQIIEIGISNRKLMTRSFIIFCLKTMEFESDESNTKFKKIKEVLFKENKVQDVIDLVNLSNLTTETDPNILAVAWKIFSDNKQDINKRIYVSNALIKQINLNPSFTKNIFHKETLILIALGSKKYDCDVKQLSLSTLAFQCLKFESDELSYNFYEKYYLDNIRLKLTKGLENISNIRAVELSKLDKYFACYEVSRQELYSLLETLSIILYNGYSVDTSLFLNFVQDEWHKELLVYVLLGKALETDPGGWSEVKEFMEQVQIFKDFIVKKNNEVLYTHKKIENILKLLINKQNDLKYSLKQIISILLILQKQDVNVEQFFDYDNEKFAYQLVHFEFLWLENICKEKNFIITDIPGSDSELHILQKLIEPYDTKIIEDLFEKAEVKSKVIDLRVFFSELNGSPLSETEKYIFLSKIQPGNVSQWKLRLLRLEIRILLTSHFPDYLKHIHVDLENKNSSSSKGLVNTIKTKLIKLTNKRPKFIKEKQEELEDYIDFGDETETIFYDIMIQMEEKMVLLLSLGEWYTQSLALFICNIDSLHKIRALVKSIDIIIDFELKENDEIMAIFNTSYIDELEMRIFQHAIQSRFSGTYEKDVTDLISELEEINKNKNITFLKEIKKAFYEVLNTFDSNSILTVTNAIIRDWSAMEITTWAKCFKVNFCLKTVPQAEIIAVIMRAMILASKHIPRNIQIMSVLLMLNNAEEKGRLAQINTGEGKTNIIAMISAYHALHNYQVDIVTTSTILAVPQSEELKEFYSLLDLTVSHNFNNPSGYKADVCYGPLTDFAADVLRDECNKSGRRHGRKFDIVIVDEVDSMFIDGNDHIVMLSSDMPGMDHLETLLAAIVIQIDSVKNLIREDDNGKTYFLQPKSRINDDGSLNNEENFDAVPLNCSKEKFIKDATESHIRKLVRDVEAGDGYPEIQIPTHLREFVCKVQIPKWINSAIRAKFVLKNTKHYLLRKGKIVPVDAYNTGIVQENLQWGNGIHQFLQVKHGAKLYPESLTNNYISNIGFFKRYGKRIYGLTGTLGDNKSTQFLEKVYKVDSVIIPPFKKKQHVELTPLVFNNPESWVSEIVKNCITKLECGRAVLIISKFIKDIDAFYAKFIKMKYNTSKILLFKTDDDVQVINRPIKSGEVILTTNIAGRGTDIKLDPSADENGGLHVCLTFMPINIRVEHQNTGRTSRTGNRGTSQLILLNGSSQGIEGIKKERDEGQKNIIGKAERDIEVILTKEKIFSEFLLLLEDINGRNEGMKIVELIAVKERFALWLKLEEDFIVQGSQSDVLKKFQQFRDSVIQDDKQSKLIKNPYFHTLIGKTLLHKQNYKEAIDEFSIAINLDKNFAEHAYYNRGYCLLAQYGGNMSGNRYYIDDAVGDFKQARNLLQKREDSLHLVQRASSSEMFSEQVQHKINLYNIQKQAIDLAIGPDKHAIDEQVKTLKEHLNSLSKDKTEEIDKIKEALDNMEKERKRKGVIEEAREKNRDVEVKIMGINDCLPENEIESYNDEIKEFDRNGFIGGFNVLEIKPIDWTAVLGLMIIGLSQLIAGAALAVYTLGSGITFAMNLITEGISDIITAIKDGIINRDFSWASWAVQKAISITVSIICAGYSAIKDVANTASSGIKMVSKKVINETVKSGWKLVAKKVATELAKGIAKEIVTDLANYGIDKTLIPKIQSKLVEIIEVPIQEALENSEFVKTMLKKDLENNTNTYENFIKSTSFDILDKKCKNKLLDIAKQIALGVADGKIKYFSTFRTVTNALLAVEKVYNCVPLFIEELNKRLEQKALGDHLMDSKNLNKIIDEEDKHNESSTNKPIVMKNVPEPEEKQSDINIRKDPEEQVKRENSGTKKSISTKNLSKVIVSGVSMNMLATIKGAMINPLLQTGVNYGMKEITSSLDSTLNQDIENYKALNRHIHYQDKGFRKNDSKNGSKLKPAAEVNENNPDIKKANQIIKKTESGGKSGLPEMGAISDVIDRPIEVFDEKGRLKFTIGENKSGKPVQVQYHKDREHYTVMGNKEPDVQSKGRNMCLFNVISDQTGLHPDEIKASSLTWMKENIIEFSKQSGDITRLEIYDSLKLCLGGAEYSGKNWKDAARYIDQCEGKVGHIGYRNAKYAPPPGHPRGHASKPGDPSSVEEYSKTDTTGHGKDGFNSYKCQDIVAHYALSHPKTQMEMRKMNQKNTVYTCGSDSGMVTPQVQTNSKNDYQSKVYLTEAELNLPDSQILRGGKWKNTQKVEDWKIKDVVLILRHQQGKVNDAKAPVFIQTIYPVNPKNCKP